MFNIKGGKEKCLGKRLSRAQGIKGICLQKNATVGIGNTNI